MNKVTIKAETVNSGDDFHTFIAEALNFPEYYGRNLDALHDCLTDIAEETVINIDNTIIFKANLGKYADRILRVFKDSARENEHLEFEEN